MYETQFGLNRRPFPAVATGSDVFVGPQTAAAMAGLKKALRAPDAIVAVAGPVGVGKTTVVRRALDAIGEKPVVIWVSRMQLGHDEVLELLLEEMGIELPSGTVQRFTRFRRQLKRYADEGSRVFIVVEDAVRIGADALSELEALTATDAGVSEGANIVLMGDESLDTALQASQLARLRQRLRLRQTIVPLSNAEQLGYLKHCFRLAGAEFDQVFEAGAADVLHRLSGGIPRVANNLVESSLISAADNRLDRVNVAQIKLVASEEYDLSLAGLPEAPPASDVAARNSGPVTPEHLVARAAPPEPEPAAPEPTAAATKPLVPEPKPAAPTPMPPEPKTAAPEPPPVTKPPADAEAAAEPKPAAGAPPGEDSESDIPELIQDTLPDLEVLAPKLASPPKQKPVQKAAKPAAAAPAPPQPAAPPRPASPSTPAAKEQLTAAQVEAPEEEVPEWEKDPTLAQLRPDLDALEQAMAVAQGLAADPEADDSKDDTPPPQAPELVPEITLDREIQAKVDEAAEQLRQEAERRAAAEAAKKAKEKEKGIDSRPTAEILAEANARNGQPDAPPDSSLEAQFDAGLPTLELEADTEDLYASSDTVHEIPVLSDATEPAFEPAAHRNPAAEPKLELEPDPIPELKPEPIPELTPDPDPAKLAKDRKADAELERIASSLAQAKTIDDCDDKMAETLFGEEFSMMAAQVAAMAPPELLAENDPAEPANDDIDESPINAVPDFDGAAAVNVEIESGIHSIGQVDKSASQRLATVRALSTGRSDPSANDAAVSAEAAADAPAPPVDQPQSIEEQMDSSMTQTLKTLNVTPPVDVDSGEDSKPKGGFFSRFRR